MIKHATTTMNDFLHKNANVRVEQSVLRSMVSDARKLLEDDAQLAAAPGLARLANFVASLDNDVTDLDLQDDCIKRIGVLVSPYETMGGAPMTAYFVEAETAEHAMTAVRTLLRDEMGDYSGAIFRPTVEYVRKTRRHDFAWINRRLNGEYFIARSIRNEDSPFAR